MASESDLPVQPHCGETCGSGNPGSQGRRIHRQAISLALLGVVLGAFAAAATESRDEAPPRSISLRSAVLLSLQNSLDLEIERLEPRLAWLRVEIAKAEFDPLFSWTGERIDGERFANSVLETLQPLNGEEPIEEEQLTSNLDFYGKASSGTEYSFSLVTPVLDTNNPVRLYDVSYTPRATLALRQPLLRDGSKSVNRVRVRQAENLEAESINGLQGRMLQAVYDVERAYWTAAYAQHRLEIKRDALDLGESLVQRLEAMKESGLADDLDLLRPRLEVERRLSEVARAEADVLNAQTRLRSLIDPSLDGTTRFEVSDEIPESDPPEDYEAIVEAALLRRPEIKTQETVIRNLELDQDRADDQVLWRLDATGKTWYSGLSGHDPGPLVRDPVTTGDSGFIDAFDDGAFSWSVGFELQIPLGRRHLLAGADTTALRISQERTRLELLKNRIAVEVETTHRDLVAEWTRLEIARRAVELAHEQFDVQTQTMETGLATIVDVIEAQDQLTETLDSENNALLRYAIARSGLDAANATAFDTYELVFDLQRE
jgi:outer membrane protein TolC